MSIGAYRGEQIEACTCDAVTGLFDHIGQLTAAHIVDRLGRDTYRLAIFEPI